MTEREIPTGWIETTLGEVVVLNYGKGLVASKRISGNVPVYGSSGITGWHNESYVKSGGLIVGRKGSVGSIFKSIVPFFPIDTVYYITEKDLNGDIDFFFYLLSNLKLDQRNSDSAVPGLNRNEAYSLPILLPPLPEQEAIAKILGSLDDKIELLREQNETLELMGQELFKEWFGRYSPDRPEELPEGWRVGKLGEIVDLLNGFAYKSSDFSENGKYKLVTIANVQDGIFVKETKDRLDNIPEKMPDYCHLKTGDTLLSLTGNVGRVCHVIGENYFLNQRVAKLVGKEKQDYGYVYTLFRQKEMIGLLESISAGTAQQNLSPIKTAQLESIIPSRDTLDNFSNIVNPMIDKILDNNLQIQSLSTSRDTLLPRLMCNNTVEMSVKGTQLKCQ